MGQAIMPVKIEAPLPVLSPQHFFLYQMAMFLQKQYGGSLQHIGTRWGLEITDEMAKQIKRKFKL